MQIKKLAASVIAVITAVTTSSFGKISNDIPYDYSPPNNDDAAEPSQMSMDGKDSLGRYISDLVSADDRKGAPMSNKTPDRVYTVTDLKFDPVTMTAHAESSQSTQCSLRISIIDDETGTIAANKEIPVDAGNNIISETVFSSDTLPEYYFVTAVLINELGEVLTVPFSFNNYTREMQEIYETDIYDFSTERIVNFDSDPTTNFLVLNEDTIMSESTDDTNKVLSADYDNNVFVFENPDDTLLNAEEGQNIYVIDPYMNSIALQVESIEKDDNTLTIKGNDDNYEEMFDFIKIETDLSSENAEYETYDAENLENVEVTELPGVYYPSSPTALADSETELEMGSSFEISADYKLGKNTTLNGKVVFSCDGDVNFYKRLKYVNFDFSSTYSVKISANVETETEFDINQSLIKFYIPTQIPSCGFIVDLKLIAKASCSIGIEKNISITHGVRFDSDTDSSPHSYSSSDTPDSEDSLKLSGKIYVGIGLDLTFKVITTNICSITAGVSAGFEISAEKEFSASDLTDTDPDCIHGCSLCIEGDIDLVLNANVSVKLLYVFNFDLIDAEFRLNLNKWHISDGGPLKWGPCPNKKYKVEVIVSGVDNPSEVCVELNDDSEYLGSDSKYETYLSDGRYYLSVYDYSKEKSETLCSKYINVAGKKRTINIKGDPSANGGNESEITTVSYSRSTYTTTTTTTQSPERQAMNIYAAGKLGDNIDYIIYNDGYMYVGGWGKMYDSPSYPRDAVTDVIVENAAEDLVITNVGDSAFASESIKSVVLPDTITDIGSYAFSGSSITSFTPPKSLKTIGSYAFYYCSSLKEFSFPSDTTDIKTGVLYGCSALTSITIPKTVTAIGSEAFAETAIKKAFIPKSVQTYGAYIFRGCKYLEEVEIENGADNYGYAEYDDYYNDSNYYSYMFSGCYSLKKLTIPYAGGSSEEFEQFNEPIPLGLWMNDGKDYSEYTYDAYIRGYTVYIPKTLTEIVITGGDRIPESAFSGLSSLTSIILPNTIKTIEEYAFYDCSGLKTLTLPKSVTTLEDHALGSMDGLTEFAIPETVTSIGSGIFSGCNNLKKITVPKSITKLPSDAFSYLHITSISLPDTLTSIGSSAFNECDKLSAITIPSSVTEIGSHAFADTPIKKIFIPKSVQKYGAYIFQNCKYLEEVEIENGSDNYGYAKFDDYYSNYSYYSYMFNGCYSLKKLTIPYAGGSSEEFKQFNEPIPIVVWMNDGKDDSEYTYEASVYNSQLSRTTGIPKTLTTIVITGGDRIPENAFCGLSSLTSVSLPNTIKKIEGDAFNGCSGLKTLVLPKSVTTLEDRALCNMDGLTEYAIPETVTSIGSELFLGCDNLKKITVPESITKLPSNAFSNLNITSVSLPDTLTSIGSLAFNDCDKLSAITIPSSVTEIGSFAFSDTPIKKVFIPKSVQKYGTYIFSNCKYLEEIEIENGSDNYGYNNFNDGYNYHYSNMLYGCYSMKKLTIPYAGGSSEEFEDFNKTTPLGMWLNDDKDDIKYTYDAESFNSEMGQHVYIPNTLTSIVITGGNRIPDGAFSGLSSLTSITIPDTVKTVEQNAFYGCTGLIDMVFPKSVTIIDETAFAAAKVKNVYFYNAYTSIPELPEDTVIYGYSTSTAKEYAAKNGNKFIPLYNETTTTTTITTVKTTSATTVSTTVSTSAATKSTTAKSTAATTTKNTSATTKNTTANSTQTTTSIAVSTVTTTADKTDKHENGDINEDGSINLKDVVLLRRYIAGGWNVTLDETTADINKDGSVNLKDVVLLRRYIAGGWNVKL